MLDQSKKTAVVLFNLGGPDSEEAIKPFLFNLFYDRSIINLPNPFRFLAAKLISSIRESEAKKIYSHLGGRSPILEETKKQSDKLQLSLNEDSKQGEFKTFICMRHWHPMSDEVTWNVKEYSPDQIVFLPLYPQFSTTTSGSSFEDFKDRLKFKKINIPIKTICCYPIEINFIKAHVRLISEEIKKIKKGRSFRILFSAHGLPERIIKAGDPYQTQVEETVNAVIEVLDKKGLDYRTTYQSKVGPLKWIAPSTEDEIKLAAKSGLDLIIVPITFVSEHSETLVELDIEYKSLVSDYDIEYNRIKTLGTDDMYINSLKESVLSAIKDEDGFIGSNGFMRFCDENLCKCIAQ